MRSPAETTSALIKYIDENDLLSLKDELNKLSAEEISCGELLCAVANSELLDEDQKINFYEWMFNEGNPNHNAFIQQIDYCKPTIYWLGIGKTRVSVFNFLVKHNHVEAMKLFTSYANLHQKEISMNSSLMIAVSNSCTAAKLFLLSEENPYLKDVLATLDENPNAITLAAKYGNIAAMDELYSVGYRYPDKESNFFTANSPLYAAVSCLRHDFVRYLLFTQHPGQEIALKEIKNDFTLTRDVGLNPMLLFSGGNMLAQMLLNGQYDIALLLLDAGAKFQFESCLTALVTKWGVFILIFAANKLERESVTWFRNVFNHVDNRDVILKSMEEVIDHRSLATISATQRIIDFFENAGFYNDGSYDSRAPLAKLFIKPSATSCSNLFKPKVAMLPDPDLLSLYQKSLNNLAQLTGIQDAEFNDQCEENSSMADDEKSDFVPQV